MRLRERKELDRPIVSLFARLNGFLVGGERCAVRFVDDLFFFEAFKLSALLTALESNSLSSSHLKVNFISDKYFPPLCVSMVIGPLPSFQALLTQLILQLLWYTKELRTFEPQIKNPIISSLLFPRQLPLITIFVPPVIMPQFGDMPV